MAVIGAWGDQATMQPSVRATAIGLLEAAVLAAQNAAGSAGGEAGAVAGAAAGVAAVQPLLAQADQAKDEAQDAARMAASERALAFQAQTQSRVYAVNSAESSGSAQEFALLAASSAAQAMVNGRPYTSISAGLAGTAEGEPFDVYGSAVGLTNAFVVTYRKVSNAAVYIDTFPNKAAYDAVAPSAARGAEAAYRGSAAPLPNFADLTGGPHYRVYDPDNADAGQDIDADGVFATTDTLNKRQTNSYGQTFSNSVDLFGPTSITQRLTIGGAAPQTETVDQPQTVSLSTTQEIYGSNGVLLLGFDGLNSCLYVGQVMPVPQTDGTLWRRSRGSLGIMNKPGWYTGQHSYLPEQVPPPQCILSPVVKYPDQAPELATRVYILIPSVCKIGNRLFFAWCGDAVHPEEGAGNFIILAYSDDEGLTKTEFAYVLHPEPTIARTMMPQLWVDQYGKLQLIFSMNYAFPGIAGGDDRHGVWNLPINSEMGAKPRCGRAWQVSTYGIPGRPVWVDDRFLVNVDLVENATSGLPAPGPISAWRGKSIFEIDTRTRSAEKLGHIPNSAAFASYQESSTVQLRDGSLLTMFRTRTPGSAPIRSAQISRSPDGEPNNFGPLADFAALPPNPTTRAAMVMSANGRPLVAFNNHPSQRTSMTLAVLNDDATAILQSVLIDQMTGVSTSYPSIWCDGDNIYVIYDGGRDSAKQIIMVKVSEAALIAGTAIPIYRMIEDQ
ncbi:sialidase family protein [Sphingobium sp. WCS2017Hpa-17]|uniref:sialidase family protein n=1 Tax=Sphingobium sp. WCS2017Hpa-17 TaxID=3073638 RepID=UPI00288C10CC|nr:sialidase family protein [Sphingobium sp. WCS2017Hpa-17]